MNTIQIGEGPSTQFQTYEALLNKKRKTEEEDPTSRRKVVHTTDGRVWYAPKLHPAYSESQNITTNNTSTSTNQEKSATTIFLGSDNSLPIDPYGTFRNNNTKENADKETPNNDSDNDKKT